MSLSLNTRRRKILNLLMGSSEFLSPHSIAQALNVSRRTIYYDFDKINEWLREQKLPEMEMVREKGVYLSEAARTALSEVLEDSSSDQTYLFSPEERMKCMICYFIYSSEPIYIEQLIECFDISRNTIFSDLKVVNRQLSHFDLELCYHPRTGYYLDGDPIRARALFVQYFVELQLLFTGGLVKFFSVSEISDYHERLTEIAHQLKVEYVKDSLLSIAALVPICYNRNSRIQFDDVKFDELKKTKEFLLVHQYFNDLPADEQIYLTLHLLGTRLNIVPDEYFEERTQTNIHELAEELIAEFERIACLRFEDPEALEHALSFHLSTSMYRYRYGIQIGNVLANDIIEQYPNIFAITKRVAQKLEKKVGTPVPDSEIAYLTLHFGSSLKISEADDSRLRILIVCVNGISTGNMLKHEVERLLPFAEIADVRAAVDLMNVQEECNLIISTIRLNSVVPVITVHPILTEFDRKSILNHPLIAHKSAIIQRDDLFSIIKKYVEPKYHQELIRDLDAYLQGESELSAAVREDDATILNTLSISKIRIVNEAIDWRDSIRCAGQPLIDVQSITEDYLSTIISQIENYGSYMFITEDIVLAHAKPEDGVNRLDMSVAVLKNPVTFSEDRHGRLLILLAAEDQEKHLRILQDIITLANHESFINEITACETPTSVMQLITKILMESGS
ncbi:MAG: BglG family transcription antiterminator [Lachnospiraceae bacterium]|nr:BglG family transcription antiterminator [Lachnospiraceae bacterium]